MIVELEVHHGRVVLPENRLNGFRRAQLPFTGNIRKRLSVEVGPLVDKHNFVGTTTYSEHSVGRIHDLLARFRVIETRNHCIMPTSRGPVGHRVRPQAALCRRVWMMRRPDVDATDTSIIDQLRANIGATVIVGTLQVVVAEDTP